MKGRNQIVAVGLLMGAAIAAPPAFALDCAVYDLTSAFWGYQNNPATFELVYGVVSDLHNPRHNRADDTVTWDATFTGFRASANAFDRPMLTELAIVDVLGTGIIESDPEPMRMSEWVQREPGLIFLQQSGDGYSATSSFCWSMVDTDPANVALALDCLNGRRCPKPE
ncbi:MAG: hypothetical protein ACRC6I_08130 [Paracoccaceae bacterium]